MIAKNPKNISQKFRDDERMQRSLNAALEDARKLHAAHGVPMVTMRDGKIVEVDPVTLEVVRVIEDDSTED